MTATFRSISSNQVVDQPSITISKPAGVIDGDLLLMVVATSDFPVDTISTPSGWNVLDNNNDGSELSAATFWKRAAGEPASYTVSYNQNGYVQCQAAILAYATAQGIRDHEFAVRSSGSSPTPPALKGIQPTDLAVVAYSIDSSEGINTPGGGWTVRLNSNLSPSMLIIDQLGVGTAPSTTDAFGFFADEWIVNTVAITPLGSGDFLTFFMS